MRTKRRKPACIYAIRCKKTGRVYIGCAVNVESRTKAHFSELRNFHKTAIIINPRGERTLEKSMWQKDYEKYGEKSFEIYTLEKDVSPDDCDKRENYWIEKYHADDPVYGYNLRKQLAIEYDFKTGLPPLPEVGDSDSEEES